MRGHEDRYLDAEAGPVVRPYALTHGRTRHSGPRLDLITLVTAATRTRPEGTDLSPEHLELLRRCVFPASIADLSADLDLPLGVVQILLADLRERSLINVHHPIPPARLPDQQVLKEVADALRRL
ncbi:MAG TPA: DUF742 domain-containing protein [Streptosporangiaceae bacterium]|nr:DUF742 domain-containing protein [Streptosporangiaceae bacterium]